MFCYGEKEEWYTRKVARNGMLPAISIDGRVITESDVILAELEEVFGPLEKSIEDPGVRKLRAMERQLFRSWCQWLCYPSASRDEAERNKQRFVRMARTVDRALRATNGPYFLSKFSVVDCIFVPYVERMCASLFYYKGFVLRDEEDFPNICAWFDALETRSTYRGMQSDFHTHVHDLPPQMGGCFASGDAQQKRFAAHVDEGPWETLPDSMYADANVMLSKRIAATRVLKHRESILRANPVSDKRIVDTALRVVLTTMLDDERRVANDAKMLASSPEDAAIALLYIRDRINVPRDMPIWSARYLRKSLDAVVDACASSAARKCAVPIDERHRRDQDPRAFGHGGPGDEYDAKRAQA
eukprot:g3318.t1